ncbi:MULTISPECIES: bifunctional phosphoribosyl-AMP cyclohydrolase/phosphoribosyl-ATP diphosphatase HisIE [unclassified Spirosoma]|uniref:bifunctional phosphoribosyl-AMP cyclohydrolase/phosphoribosyl-ATP diphosphatase HisIE n=1 Tax=unclassified Spirosoma TaxID=2621999 RepID=UPI000958F9BF|nr:MULTISPECIES: bifunctional phosphoribosyl-AMP cyclohydrolase/phosphoribosyl-ATP diphosphatase HisIE [unclassified Spirosoma]MBN8823997.1 bifunctional phosphoribosyl-AMP cyclohydrolase/phosphoribosyl-ATP diphosphatase HisIE [Spirosoma sp.]OJW70408.1 MAG: bifunctional phosphoribosyl-AMP cyclohydrolase/phosphoribosyl-ATP diphosphatase [Spirosoma sp. 48-14]
MTINFDKSPDGLVPAVIQDAETGKVLMLGYMNQEAYDKTVAENIVTFFSRSKQRLWTKGETSNNFLHVREILVDCDGDTLLVKASPAGPVCHTGADTCFQEVNHGKGQFLNYLQQVIHDRKVNPSDQSYTASLFNKGVNKIAQKVGEEAVELVIEAKDNNDHLFKGEAADLLFHFLVLLEQKNIQLDDIVTVLQGRHSKQ